MWQDWNADYYDKNTISKWLESGASLHKGTLLSAVQESPTISSALLYLSNTQLQLCILWPDPLRRTEFYQPVLHFLE